MRVIEPLGRVTYPDGGYHEIQLAVATWEGDNPDGEVVVRGADRLFASVISFHCPKNPFLF